MFISSSCIIRKTELMWWFSSTERSLYRMAHSDLQSQGPRAAPVSRLAHPARPLLPRPQPPPHLVWMWKLLVVPVCS